MTTGTIDELPLVRAELNHLVGVRTADGLTPQEQRRYEALLLREAELLICGQTARVPERGATAIEYALVVAMFVIICINLLTPVGS